MLWFIPSAKLTKLYLFSRHRSGLWVVWCLFRICRSEVLLGAGLPLRCGLWFAINPHSRIVLKWVLGILVTTSWV